jgi:plasmid maintenance system antidote protein VapI
MKKQAAPITDLLRETIIASKLPLLTLQQETGVKRASIMRFIRGRNSIRLDIADKLAAYFELKLVRSSKKKSERQAHE